MSETESLLERVRLGDPLAISKLLEQHRNRLCDMVTLRMDDRVVQRFDPSDVVQDGLADAYQRLPVYARERPIPFYPWIRQIVLERLIQYHRRHLYVQSRSVEREKEGWNYTDRSTFQLVDRLIARDDSPLEQISKQELRRRVRSAMDGLTEMDRELITLRFLEQLTVKEIAAVLGISPNAVGMRQLRALQRFEKLLKESQGSADE